MNTFVLDYDPRVAAKYHMDVHVIKMIIESLQMLSCCAYHYQIPTASRLYKSTHKSHPCNLWLIQSFENVVWLRDLLLALCEEYTYRYGRVIKCEEKLNDLEKCLLELQTVMPSIGVTPFALAMPDECKTSDAVESYRSYYLKFKKDMPRAGWRRGRLSPRWFSYPNHNYFPEG